VLKEADFREAKISSSNLSDNVLHLADFSGAQASNSQFRHCKMHGAVCTHGNFERVDFSFAEMHCNFNHANLQHANLYGCDLASSDFTHSDLRSANMTGAKIRQADFTYAKLVGSTGTNGKPWGSSGKAAKKSWWSFWKRTAAL
jgi:uncharacterized protein YjbI with pentapeptide repeats